MSSKKKQTKGPKSNDLDVESKQASKRQSKDIEMDGDSNLDASMNENEDLVMANDVEAKTDKKAGNKRVYKSGLCVKCNRVKYIRNNSMCHTCYKQHLKAKREKEGQKEPKLLVICLKCNLLKKHHGRQLCKPCYTSAHKSKKLNQYSTTRVKSHFGNQGICVKCNESKSLYKRFMCLACYKKDKRERHKAGVQKCGNCGKLELLELNGFCSECNSDERVRKMADGSNLIDQKLKVILKSIEENEFIASADLTVNACLATYAKYFEQFSKIKIDFGDLDESNDADLDEESVGPSNYAIGNEDFIDRLKQYTRSKLKPLKNQNPLNADNASSIFNVAKSAKSKIKSPSKLKGKKSRKVNLKECIDCKQMKPHSARGRCSACYARFMRQKKKEDAEKVKVAEKVEKNSSQNDETQKINADQVEAPSVKSKKKRSEKQATDA